MPAFPFFFLFFLIWWKPHPRDHTAVCQVFKWKFPNHKLHFYNRAAAPWPCKILRNFCLKAFYNHQTCYLWVILPHPSLPLGPQPTIFSVPLPTLSLSFHAAESCKSSRNTALHMSMCVRILYAACSPLPKTVSQPPLFHLPIRLPIGGGRARGDGGVACARGGGWA